MRSRRTRDQPADPYAGAPVDELAAPLLPRWFVLLVLLLIPVAVVLFLLAFPWGEEDAVPVAERRPPPAEGLTTDVGDWEIGEATPQPLEADCAGVEGLQTAGTVEDRRRLGEALNSLCGVVLPEDAGAALAALADAEAVVRFGAFERSGVDVTAVPDADPPLVLPNGRFAQAAEPRWVAPLIVYEAVRLAGDPATARTTLAAREAERVACDAVLDEDRNVGCEDAVELLALDDPLARLRAAGFE